MAEFASVEKKHNDRIAELAGGDIDTFNICIMLKNMSDSEPLDTLYRLGLRGRNISELYKMLGNGYSIEEDVRILDYVLGWLGKIGDQHIKELNELCKVDGKLDLKSFIAVAAMALYSAEENSAPLNVELDSSIAAMKALNIKGSEIFYRFVKYYKDSFEEILRPYFEADASMSQAYNNSTDDQKGIIFIKAFFQELNEIEKEKEDVYQYIR
ncbi:MAG: hypothetical protein QXW10_03330 [Candidatus Micrarchaeaceae archaeon]